MNSTSTDEMGGATTSVGSSGDFSAVSEDHVVATTYYDEDFPELNLSKFSATKNTTTNNSTTTATTTSPTTTTPKKEEKKKQDLRWTELIIDKEHDYMYSDIGHKQSSRLLFETDAFEHIPRQCRWILWDKLSRVRSHASQLPPHLYDLFLKDAYQHVNVSISSDATTTTTIDHDNGSNMLPFDEWTCINYNNSENNGHSSEEVKNVRQILLDIPRTCDEKNFMFDHSKDQAKQSMFHILYSLSKYYPSVGYCQGMSYICAELLSVMETEEDSFLMFLTLMDRYELHQLYLPGFPKLQQIRFVFDRLFKKRDQRLFLHLERLGVTSDLYLTKWYLSLFCVSFPQEFVLRLWDAFLFKGWIVMHQLVFSMLNFFRRDLLACRDMDRAIDIIHNDLSKFVSSLDNRQKVFYMSRGMFTEQDMSRFEREYEQEEADRLRRIKEQEEAEVIKKMKESEKTEPDCATPPDTPKENVANTIAQHIEPVASNV